MVIFGLNEDYNQCKKKKTTKLGNRIRELYQKSKLGLFGFCCVYVCMHTNICMYALVYIFPSR